MPHTDKQYRKRLRTYKFVIYMVLSAMFVIGVGLLFIWLYDKLGGSFMSRGWQIFFMITFALLAAALQIPEYLADLRKIDLEDETNTASAKPKPYAAALDHARKEGFIDENNQLQGSRSEFVRFCIANKYFHPYGREDWKSIDNLLKGPGGKPVTAEQLAQTFQDIRSREGV